MFKFHKNLILCDPVTPVTSAGEYVVSSRYWRVVWTEHRSLEEFPQGPVALYGRALPACTPTSQLLVLLCLPDSWAVHQPAHITVTKWHMQLNTHAHSAGQFCVSLPLKFHFIWFKSDFCGFKRSDVPPCWGHQLPLVLVQLYFISISSNANPTSEWTERRAPPIETL